MSPLTELYAAQDDVAEWANTHQHLIMNGTASITWTLDLLAQLKAAYGAAVAMRQEHFIFRNQQFDTRYASHLIRYLSSTLNSSTI